MDTLRNVQRVIETQLQSALKNPYIMAVLKITLILYASQIAPKLSSKVSSVFQYTIVKIVCVALIAFAAEVDFQLAIILAVVFVLSINLLSGRGPLESYENALPNSVPSSFANDNTNFTDLLGKPTKPNNFKILESHTDNYPGCDSVKLKDLLAVFNNDALKLQKTVQYTYHELMNKMPKGTPKENLQKIARSIGLPYNVELNDANAPVISTMLLQYGYTINETCTAPN